MILLQFLPLKEKNTMHVARPAHPGQFIRMEILEPLELSVTRLALVDLR